MSENIDFIPDASHKDCLYCSILKLCIETKVKLVEFYQFHAIVDR